MPVFTVPTTRQGQFQALKALTCVSPTFSPGEQRTKSIRAHSHHSPAHG